ncbi:hypothetical protein LHS21_002614 [Salmonella enterica subsp. enterica serovar Newport]|nr:hypothetical protein [Salmonella enterica subsp. enterica serovar Newport]
MRKNTSTAHLFDVRIRQMGNPTVTAGLTYDAQGGIRMDAGDNRNMRRIARKMLRKEGKL